MASATDPTSPRNDPPLDAALLYPCSLAFVLKLHWSSDAATHRLSGRIEHVASGRRAVFRNVAELQGWLEDQLGRPDD